MADHRRGSLQELAVGDECERERFLGLGWPSVIERELPFERAERDCPGEALHGRAEHEVCDVGGGPVRPGVERLDVGLLEELGRADSTQTARRSGA
jgi:hypothetical protein